MSDLQFALLAIGVVVVAGVYAFNWWQERQFRRRAEHAFADRHEDVLLRGAANEAREDNGQRIEPTVSAVALDIDELPAPRDVPELHEPQVPAQMPDVDAAPAQTEGDEQAIDYCVQLEAAQPIAVARLQEALQRLTDFDKRITCAVFDDAMAVWRDAGPDAAVDFRRAQLALQLVDRTGPVTHEALVRFRDGADAIALGLAATAACRDIDEALSQAMELDKFCIEADIAVGLNIVGRDGAQFAGTKIRALAEAAGFRLDDIGIFRFSNEHKQDLFTLDNLEAAPFVPEQIKSISTHGVTLLFDVPKAAGGLRAFDRMVEIARSFATALGGSLVDDNKTPLTANAIEKIRAQLRAVYAKMDARGIAPGGVRARRLFS